MINQVSEWASFNWENRFVIVTGGGGFLGSYVVDKLLERGVSPKNLLVPRQAEYDLRRSDAIERLFADAFSAGATADQIYLIHLAATSGGIGYNRKNPGTLVYDNVMMQTQLLEAARQHQIAKFIGIGSVSAYPKYAPVPFQVEDLWNGYPEEITAPYGVAKKVLLVQCQAYRDQFGFDAIYLLASNLYGPGDRFEQGANVIPDLIRKFTSAVSSGLSEVTAWGDGSPTREFLFAADAAEAIVKATERYSDRQPVNIGSGSEINIRDLVKLIGRLTDFKGEIKWDTSKPNGQPRRRLDTTQAANLFGFTPSTKLEAGLEQTINWYQKSR
ncbi:MAG: GDP-L-fucose synthase family protein [Candidatus Promineifilaceae bacterium]